MFIIQHYSTAVIFCVVTMFCWGSWANTQKLAGKSWRFELFYWDYVIGIFLFSLLSAFTLGSIGSSGRGFLADLSQAGVGTLGSAFIGGVIFNAANILLAAAIAIAGMAVAFPVGIGLALVLGVVLNYAAHQQGNAVLLFSGVFLVCLAIFFNAMAYQRKGRAGSGGGDAHEGRGQVSSKGILLALGGGLLMSFFYRFIAASMDMDNFVSPAVGKMTPYTAVFVFSCGILGSNLIFNTLLIKKPFTGVPTSYAAYWKGNFKTHLTGVAGGLIWGLGNSFNLIAAGKAGPAISYGLGQGATLIAALWGVFVWREFRNSPPATYRYLGAMFVVFIAGLGCIIYAGRDEVVAPVMGK